MKKVNNIGCYGGAGADTEYEEGFFDKLLRKLRDVKTTIVHEIMVIFD